MGKFKGTIGEWVKDYRGSRGHIKAVKEGIKETPTLARFDIFSKYGFKNPAISKEEEEENAKLICDAGNVRQQIDCDLPELLKQRDELLKALENVKDQLRSGILNRKDILDIEQLINSIKKS